jgi:hypothetical protein
LLAVGEPFLGSMVRAAPCAMSQQAACMPALVQGDI